MVIPLLFSVVFLFIMSGVLRQNKFNFRQGDSNQAPETAGQILDKRFAKGGINKTEYKEMKVALGYDESKSRKDG